jgi:hypothetical protein
VPRRVAQVGALALARRVEGLGPFLFLLTGVFASLSELMAVRAAAPSVPSASWENVREQTTCEAMQDDYCLGRYGFTIKHSGTFIAGPSGRGSKVEDQIKLQELRRLRELIDRVSTGLSSAKKTCEPGALPGIKDQVDITFTGGTIVRVYDLGGSVGRLCYVGSWEQVRELHEYLHGLMARYYPLPFPH